MLLTPPLISFFGTATAVGGLFAPAPVRSVCHALAVVMLGPRLGEKTYTKLSLMMMVYCLLEELSFPDYRSPGVPAMLVNFCAISLSFHFSVLLDPTGFPRLASFSGWSMGGFHIRNFMVHILPVVVLFLWTARDLTGYAEAVSGVGPSLGLITATNHLIWSFLTAKGLDLSEVYLYFHPWIWSALWVVALVTHVVMGAVWQAPVAALLHHAPWMVLGSTHS